MTGIFLVDDHEVVRRGLASLLNAQAGMQIVGEASTLGEAVARIPAAQPDVALLDVHLPDGSGIDLCRHIRQEHPTVRCMILTGYDEDDAALAAVLADAAGYLMKTVRAADLVDAVRAVAAGKQLLSPRLVKRAADRFRSHFDEDPRFGSLNLRERQILALIADALTNRAIADQLGLAEKTVKNYVTSLLHKLGFEHRTQAAVFEIERVRAAGDAAQKDHT